MDSVTSLHTSGQPYPSRLPTAVNKAKTDDSSSNNISDLSDEITIERLKNELKDYILNANYRMEVRMHDKLQQVVVKVIDRETDKVVKELPATVIQNAHVRIREVLGLLIDEKF